MLQSHYQQQALYGNVAQAPPTSTTNWNNFPPSIVPHPMQFDNQIHDNNASYNNPYNAASISDSNQQYYNSVPSEISPQDIFTSPVNSVYNESMYSQQGVQNVANEYLSQSNVQNISNKRLREEIPTQNPYFKSSRTQETYKNKSFRLAENTINPRVGLKDNYIHEITGHDNMFQDKHALDKNTLQHSSMGIMTQENGAYISNDPSINNIGDDILYLDVNVRNEMTKLLNQLLIDLGQESSRLTLDELKLENFQLFQQLQFQAETYLQTSTNNTVSTNISPSLSRIDESSCFMFDSDASSSGIEVSSGIDTSNIPPPPSLTIDGLLDSADDVYYSEMHTDNQAVSHVDNSRLERNVNNYVDSFIEKYIDNEGSRDMDIDYNSSTENIDANVLNRRNPASKPILGFINDSPVTLNLNRIYYLKNQLLSSNKLQTLSADTLACCRNLTAKMSLYIHRCDQPVKIPDIMFGTLMIFCVYLMLSCICV